MQRKVFEQKFLDSAQATDFLNRTGWTYNGKKGLLRQYHLYRGIEIDFRGNVVEEFTAHSYPDGHVELYVDRSTSSLISGGFPTFVYSSRESYAHLKELVLELNVKLTEEYGQRFTISWNGQQAFNVHALEPIADGFGKAIKQPSLATFSAPKLAFEWAVDQCAKDSS